MKKTFDYLLSFLPYLYIFIGSLYSPSDPDLGWHLKYGEHFFKHGHILRENTFSALMPDYKWSNTSWGTDLITFSAYNLGGFFAITILGALVVTLTFYFFSKAAKLKVWDQVFIFPLLLYLLIPINTVSFRGQQVSLMLLGVLFFILSLYKKNFMLIFAIIPLFLIWVNLHGQFILGLIMLSGWVATYILKLLITDIDINNFFLSLKTSIINNKSELYIMSAVLVLSGLVTLINPFGIGVHSDALGHIGSPLLKNVSEYLPLPAFSRAWWNHIILASLLGMGLIYLFLKEKIMSQLPVIFSILSIFILSFFVRRFAWPAYYLTFSILKPIPGFFKPDSKKSTQFSALVILIVLIIISITGKLPLSKLQNYNWNEYCKDRYMRCSPESAEYLRKNNLTSNLYTVYVWGGYLIWNYPEIKPVIDGRMHMWRDENGYSGFEDYYAIEQNITDIDKTNYNVAYMSPDKPVYDRLNELVGAGKWRVAHRDDYSGVFVRNK